VMKDDKAQESPLHRDSFRLVRSRYTKSNGELDLTSRPKISGLGQFLASNVFLSISAVCGCGCVYLSVCMCMCV
jgi:hypothetical protein